MYLYSTKTIINNAGVRLFAYIRVSTEQQSYNSQRFEIEKWCAKMGFEVDRWIEETVSGTKKVEQRVLGRLIRRMNKGDIIICTELSRLGRNMMMVMSILNTCSQKGIRIYSIKDNFELSDSLNSKIIAFAFSLASEIERNLISQRTREALAACRAAGKRLGRPPGRSKDWYRFEKLYPEIKRRLAANDTIGQIASDLKIHRNTLSRYLKEKKMAENQKNTNTF